MILTLDEPAGEEQVKQILKVPGITAVKVVKL